MNGLTFLICTYNGAVRLPQTMAHLAAQQVPAGVAWEVLLVSNASTDDTLSAGPRLWAELGAPTTLRVLDEPQTGKEHALVKGFNEACYESICIVDDDNWLAPDYLVQVVAIMDEHPEIGILGGRAEGAFEVTPPAWFNQFEGVFAVGPQAKQPGPLRATEAYLYGAGSVVRRSAWQRLCAADFKFTSTSRRGKVLSGGEDLELGYAIRIAGYELWYDDRLRFKHFMYKERLTWSYMRRIGQGTVFGMTSIVYYFLLREPDLQLRGFQRRYYRWVLWLVWQLVRQPKRLLTYMLHAHDEAYPDTFNTMRELYTLRGALTGRAEACRIFGLVKALQQRVSVAK